MYQATKKKLARFPIERSASPKIDLGSHCSVNLILCIIHALRKGKSTRHHSSNSCAMHTFRP